MPSGETPAHNDQSEKGKSPERSNLRKSVLVYFDSQSAEAGNFLVRELKSQGIIALTRDQYNFDEIDDIKERVSLRDNLGGIFIIPSFELMESDKELVKFLYDANKLNPQGSLDTTIFFLTDHDQAKSLEYLVPVLGAKITAMSLVGESDTDASQDVRIAGKDMLDRFLSVFKSQRLKS